MFQKLLGVICVVVFGMYLLTSSPAQSQDDRHVQSWKHLALTSDGEEHATLAQQINRLGNEGWELVDVENFVSAGETTKTVYFFKKPSG